MRSLGVDRPGVVTIFELDSEGVGDGQFWVDTLYSGLSAGTELTLVKGTNPYLRAQWDEELCVFREGEASTRYPVLALGYMEVGRVGESRTPAVQEGQVVAMTYGHKTGYRADAATDLFVPLPDGLDPILGIYVAQMGPICANGLLHAAADLVGPDVRSLGDGVRGRHVLVTGAGLVGLLTAVFARHHGAEVVVADRTPERLAAARDLGVATVEGDGDAVWRYCKEGWNHGRGDRGADVVFQCRGQAASLSTALRSLRPQGSVIDLAFYQGGAAEVRLGEEFHHNGLSIVCAQIGRVPRGCAFAWDRSRLSQETIDLLESHGSTLRDHLITDVVPLEQAPGFVTALAARRRPAIQAVFSFPSVG